MIEQEILMKADCIVTHTIRWEISIRLHVLQLV